MALPVVEKHAMPSDSVDSRKGVAESEKAEVEEKTDVFRLSRSEIRNVLGRILDIKYLPRLEEFDRVRKRSIQNEKQVRHFGNGCRSSKGKSMQSVNRSGHSSTYLTTQIIDFNILLIIFLRLDAWMEN